MLRHVRFQLFISVTLLLWLRIVDISSTSHTVLYREHPGLHLKSYVCLSYIAMFATYPLLPSISLLYLRNSILCGCKHCYNLVNKMACRAMAILEILRGVSARKKCQPSLSWRPKVITSSFSHFSHRESSTTVQKPAHCQGYFSSLWYWSLLIRGACSFRRGCNWNHCKPPVSATAMVDRRTPHFISLSRPAGPCTWTLLKCL